MTDELPKKTQPQTRWQRVRARLPGLVWAVPLAATILVGYLGFQALVEHGVSVHVQFGTAQGAKEGDTPVIYKGLRVGKVARIKLADDKSHIDMRLLMEEDMKSLLVEGTQFWLVGAKPSISDIQSITASVTGMSIQMVPGQGAPKRSFQGLDEPPVVMPDVEGGRYTLHTDIHGSVQPGASLYYRGEEAGKVTSVDFKGQNNFSVGIFVFKKFYGLVRPHTLFWNGTGVRIQLSSQGVTGTLPTPAELWSGGVEFGNEDPNILEDASPQGTDFPLYPDRLTALEGPDGPDVLYELTLTGKVGDLADKAPVTLNGYRVGLVRRHSLTVDGGGGNILMPVVVAIQPDRMRLPSQDGETDDQRRAITNRALSGLVAKGYRLKLVQEPPIVGSYAIMFEGGHGPGRLGVGAKFPTIPTVTAGDLSAMETDASAIVAKINAVPFVEIGNNVRDMTSRLDRLMASVPMKESLQHLASTLASVDTTMQQVQPELGPLVKKLRGAADAVQATAASANVVMGGNGLSQDASIPGAIRQLTEAARSMRDLADYLERHPESLLQGKAKESP